MGIYCIKIECGGEKEGWVAFKKTLWDTRKW